jgi:glycosyltransferase involved in cell wall biosynthesis
LQLVDEIWTGSQANADAIKKSGVTKPIKIIPQAIETEREWPKGYDVAGFPEDGFLFYSIFEFIDRKNPAALLNAYWQEFQKGEKVGLLIKTYFRDFSFVHKQEISNQIKAMKRKAELTTSVTLPPVYLYKELMDRRQVMRLHKTGDCFVSAHRGEGWGLPQVEAMLAGNPIISTGYGGCHEYFKDGSDAILLNYKMKPLEGMDHSTKWYTPEQNWAEVDVADLRRAMRGMYNDHTFAQKIGHKGQDKVKEIFNLSTVGEIMKARLNEIEAML